MLLFNPDAEQYRMSLKNLNTSHVIVQQILWLTGMIHRLYLNTSHVIVQQKWSIKVLGMLGDLNTSHVIVQRGTRVTIGMAKAFKYISCYCSTWIYRKR